MKMNWTKPLFDNLWNDLPDALKKRLIPTQIESQILHIEQVKYKAMISHCRFMKELDDWIKNLKQDLEKQV